MTEKEIKHLRKIVGYKWIPWVAFLMVPLFLIAAGMKLYFVHRICSLTGLKWAHVSSLAVSRPDPEKMYKGVELLAAGGIQDALLHFGVTIFILVVFFGGLQQRKKDALLLEYIDREKGTQQHVSGLSPEAGSART